jgi:hypothetical protein
MKLVFVPALAAGIPTFARAIMRSRFMDRSWCRLSAILSPEKWHGRWRQHLERDRDPAVALFDSVL